MTQDKPDNVTPAPGTARQPRIQFSHCAINVVDMDRMTDFYTRVMGLKITDEGEERGLFFRFLSLDPIDHHQLALCTGRPNNTPRNQINPFFDGVVNHLSFRLESLDDLRLMQERYLAEGQLDLIIGSHGNAWTIYTQDPEGNVVETFVDTPWYVSQPVLEPLDLSKSDEEILKETEALASSRPGSSTMEEWNAKMAELMDRPVVRKPFTRGC